MGEHQRAVVPQLAEPPAGCAVAVALRPHDTDSTIATVSAHGIFRPPPPVNEPIKGYTPGSPERAELQSRIRDLEGERPKLPLVIGGRDVYTDDVFPAVMPHRKNHVLADVSMGGPEHVQQAIDAAREAHHDWSRTPWHERAAVFRTVRGSVEGHPIRALEGRAEFR